MYLGRYLGPLTPDTTECSLRSNCIRVYGAGHCLKRRR
jgi:hypothetical protein